MTDEIDLNETQTPHRRRLDRNGDHAHDRITDRDQLAKINLFFDRYSKIITFLLLGILGWFMRDVVKPLEAIPVLVERQQAIDSTLKANGIKIDEQSQVQVQMADVLTILAAIRCTEFTAREKLVSRLCQKVLLAP